MIDEDFRTHLLTDATIVANAEEIAVGQVPIDATGVPLVDSYIWIGQFDENDWMDLEGETGMSEFSFDVECVSVNITTAKTLAQRMKRICQGFGYRQVMGYTTVDAVFVQAKDDEYIPVNRFQETNTTVAALDLKIWAPSNSNNLRIGQGRIGIDFVVG